MRGIRIGSLFGIPIRLDVTFLIVLPLFAWLIGNDVANLATAIDAVFGSSLSTAPLTDGGLQWMLGGAAAVGLFVGVLLHELGHALTAMRYGFRIESITLWLLGGVAQFVEMPEDWRQELIVAIVGPIVSVAVGVASAAAFLAVPEGLPAVRFVLGYLAIVNVALAAFNMLPGFPMDGGRVLRALLARNRPHAKATRLAAEVGKAFAFVIGIVGLFSNLFLVVLAFFIYIAASGEAQQSTMKAAFQDVTVGDVMTPAAELSTVAEDTSVAELLDRMFRERHTGYPVLRDGRLVGLVTLEDARTVDEIEREAFTVEDVMTSDIESVSSDDDAMTAIQKMQQHDIGRLPVVDDGDLVGLVSRSDLVTAFNIIQSRGSLDASFTTGEATIAPSQR